MKMRINRCSTRPRNAAGVGELYRGESQIENLVTAKGYVDCVAFMGAESVSVVVDDPDRIDAPRTWPALWT